MDSLPKVLDCEFEDVLPLWQSGLWPKRRSAIRHASALTIEGKKDLSLLGAKTKFWCVSSDGKICAVLSGYPTSLLDFRVRGLWVDPLWRRRGCATALMKTALSFARSGGHERVWSIPRQSAWQFYQSLGFEQLSPFNDDGMEFGPNCYAEVTL